MPTTAPAASLATLAVAAYTLLRRRIVCGEIPLGQAISRRQVALELGMSFLPVTNAMLRLEYEGLVESRPRAGTRVCVPTREQVEGQHVVRLALETHAATLFNKMATAAERLELRQRAARLDARHEARNGPSFLGLHAELHAAIAAGTHCDALAEAVDQVNALALTWLAALGRSGPAQSGADHVALAEAVSNGGPDDARRATREHLDRELDNLCGPLESDFGLRRVRGPRFQRAPRRVRRLPAAAGF